MYLRERIHNKNKDHKMKKYITVLMTAVVALMLAGCGAHHKPPVYDKHGNLISGSPSHHSMHKKSSD